LVGSWCWKNPPSSLIGPTGEARPEALRGAGETSGAPCSSCSRDPKNGPSPLEPGLEILRRRSERLAPLLAELRQRGERGDLAVPFTEIVASLIHMHAIRMLPTAARAQEVVLYRFLENLYDSQLARAGRKKKDRRDTMVASDP
jgi:hypothetical protein